MRTLRWTKMETPKEDALIREQVVRLVAGIFGSVLWQPEHNSIYWIHDGEWYIGSVMDD